MHSKRKSQSLECANRSQYHCVCVTECFQHLWGHSAPWQCKASYGQHNQDTLAEIQVGGCRSPSIQSWPLFLRLHHFWFPKKGSEGQTIHLRRRRQAVHVELVHNAAPGILWDRHSPPCVAVGPVPQQPGPILLTSRVFLVLIF